MLLFFSSSKTSNQRKKENNPLFTTKDKKWGYESLIFDLFFWRNLDLKFAYVSYLPTPQVAEHGVQALYLHLNTSVWVTVWFLGIVYSNSMPGFLVWNRSLKE